VLLVQRAPHPVLASPFCLCKAANALRYCLVSYVLLAAPTLQCMHLCRDTSPVLLATSGASLSLIELHCRSVGSGLT
jgi:hypothetical protein